MVLATRSWSNMAAFYCDFRHFHRAWKIEDLLKSKNFCGENLHRMQQVIFKKKLKMVRCNLIKLCFSKRKSNIMNFAGFVHPCVSKSVYIEFLRWINMQINLFLFNSQPNPWVHFLLEATLVYDTKKCSIMAKMTEIIVLENNRK